MSHWDKKPKIVNENDQGDKGAPLETALAEEHEGHGELLEEHAEQQEADDALEEGYKEELDVAVAALEEVQEKIRGVKEEAFDKILVIEQERNRDCKPIYSERAELISKIPSFWKFVLLQHWLLETLITDEDQEVLDYLEQVYVEENLDVKSGFTVRMQFAENPFFSNSVLEKRVNYSEDGTVKLSAVPPQWYPGKDLTQLTVLDEADEDTQQATSFFHWFTEPVDGAEDEVAETIREQIWPNPLQLYMGETGHPPPELEVGYADEEDGLVEYINDGYDQDQLEEQDLEGEGYPEGLQDDYGNWEQDPEGAMLEEAPHGEGVQGQQAEGLEGAEGDDGDGEFEEASVDEATVTAKDMVRDATAGRAQEETTPAAAVS